MLNQPTTDRHHILCERDAARGVAWLRLCRPPLNVLHVPMLRDMADALAGAARDPDLKAVVIAAAPGSRAFSAGVDVADHTRDRAVGMLAAFHDVCLRLRDLPVPALAVIDGAALGGGCELALACDLVIATPRAQFGQPEIKLGAFAPMASVLLAGAVGPKRAADWLLTGRIVTAGEAFAAGLVTRVVAEPELDAAVDGLLAELAAHSGAALRLAKRALAAGAGPGPAAERLAAVEQLYLGDLMATADVHEGLAAFIEKRPAVWANR